MAARAETILSLCSGAGQLDRGVHAALGGARTVCYVERELAAALVLAARIRDGALDDGPVWSDLFTFDGGAWRGRVRGIVAGIPCQPHSVAGKRLGEDDERDLWPHTAELIRAVAPDWFFLENVPGIARYYYARIRPELRDMGFRVAECLVTAEEVGAPHRRERLFVLADRNGGGCEPAEPQLHEGQQHSSWNDASGQVGTVADAEGRGQRVGGGAPGGAGRADGGDGTVGDTSRGGVEGDGPGRERITQTPAGVGLPRCTGGELPPFPPGPGDHAAWSAILGERPDLAPAVEPALRRVAHGLAGRLDLSRTARLRLTGNGVVPQAVEYAFRLLRGQLADAGRGGHGGGDEG